MANVIFISHSLFADDFPTHFDFSDLIQLEQRSISISRTHNISYSHKLDLRLIRFDLSTIDFSQLSISLERAQLSLDQCGIRLNVISATTYLSHPTLLTWEDLEFSGEITPWEQFFFEGIEDNSAGIILINSINWSDDPELYRGIGYAPFMANLLDLTGQEKEFYLNKIAGHIILSHHYQQHTIAHEIGHAIFNLPHHESNNNIMYPSNKLQSAYFSVQQCKFALTSPRVTPL
jgi:hypothetical protein